MHVWLLKCVSVMTCKNTLANAIKGLEVMNINQACPGEAIKTAAHTKKSTDGDDNM